MEKIIKKPSFDTILNEISLFHKECLLSVLSFIKSVQNVRGILIGGSFTNQSSDEYSDVDIFCFFDSNGLVSIKNELLVKIKTIDYFETFIAQGFFPWLGETLTIYFDYKPRFSIDLGLSDFSKLNTFFIEPQGLIILDFEDNIYKRQIETKKLKGYPKYPFFTQFPVQNTIISLHKIQKNILRGHLWNAIEYSNKIRRNLIFLIRLYDINEIEFLGNPERNIEDIFPRKYLERLNYTLPSLNPNSIAQCVYNMVTWILEIVNDSIILQETNDISQSNWISSELEKLKIWFIKYSQND